MGIAKTSIDGSEYIGVFALATDRFALLGSGVGLKYENIIREALGARVVRATVDSTAMIGIYAVANSSVILLPESIYASELRRIRNEIGEGISVETIDTDLNALGNNILANDKVAVINPDYNSKEAKRIADALGVEVLKESIGGYNTVGANNILTNKGMVANNRVSESEFARMKELFGSVEQSTANLGTISIGICAVANANGVVVGERTTGYEIAKIADALALE
jgi:translation initiation factor 6